jgi:addiction module HigA family antidote
MPRDRPPIHPGTILLEEWLQPFEISQNSLARYIGVPPRRINEIVLGKRSITADTAIRLGNAFLGTPGYWMALQAEYDIARALRDPDADFLTHGQFGRPFEY